MMDTEQAQRFLAAAQDDYKTRIARYCRLMAEEGGPDEEELREVRADVLAAQPVLHLAQYELEHAKEREREAAQTGDRRRAGETLRAAIFGEEE
jgi:hypothetical protein